MIRLKTHLLVGALLLSSAIWANTPQWSLHGYVRDETGVLLEGVSVMSDDGVAGDMTDSVGGYTLRLYQDTVRVRYVLMGFEPVTIRVTRDRKNDVRQDVILPEKVEALDDITIKSGRLEITTAKQLDISSLRNMPSVGGNSVESLLKTLQGVSSNNELSSQYSVRGGSYDENSVYVNGIEVYRPYLVRTGEQEGLSFVNTDMVGSLNFSAGGFDARFGDKLASVLDITYRKPLRFEAGVSGSLMGASAYIGSSAGHFTQLHGIRYKNASYLLGTLQTNGEYDPNFIDYQTYMTANPGKNDQWELSFLGNFSQNTYNFIPQSRSTTFGTISDLRNFKVYFSGQEQDRFVTAMGALKLSYKPSPSVQLDLTGSAFYTDERVRYDIEGEYWLSSVDAFNSDGVETGVGNYYQHARDRMQGMLVKVAHDGKWQLNKNNLVRWGLGVEYEKVWEHANDWEMRDSSGYSLPYSDDRVNVFYSLYSDNRLESFKTRAYVQDEYRLHFHTGGVMAIVGGLRLNYWKFNREFTVSPRVNITYMPDIRQDIRFRLATGIYYQTPSYKEIKDTMRVDGLLCNYLNTNIKSQRSVQVIAGFEYYYTWWRRPFKLSVEGYYKNLRNMIPYTIDNLTLRYLGQNDGKGYITGFDVKLFGEFVPTIDSWISFSMVYAMEDLEGDKHGYFRHPMNQLYNVSVFFQDYVPRFPQYRIHVLFNLSQGLPVGPTHADMYAATSMRMPTYRRVDIGLSRQFEKGKDPWMGRGFFKPFRKILIAVEVLNVFGFNNVNSYYWVTDIYNQQYAVPNYLTGRQFNVKLQLDF